MIFYREMDHVSGPWEKLRIEDARPREQMVGDLMRDIHRGTPWTTLTGNPVKLGGGTILSGDVLTIRDDYGHTYIYKVLGYDFEADLFELEWPD